MLATYVGVKYFRFRRTEYQDETIGRRTKRLTTTLILISVIVSSADSISVSELDELKEWLKVRLDTETVEVSLRYSIARE